MDVFNHGVKHAFRKMDINSTEAVSQRSTRANIWNLIRAAEDDVGSLVTVDDRLPATTCGFNIRTEFVYAVNVVEK
jgi:hypothetical protein